ncbi:uncharacterized protein LOC132723564 [Ruditapes philippinarum]|uniref:uncharacterized protein LOC132723564 n=1 Tax=Ruditapes philippinarum TaxID=129788 RepID=UPI00295AA0B0|nr:uncharacterized protein LOC132723564 [Ruditapes philippinarum]
MMEMILLVSVGTGLVFITLIFGCMSCRRKLTDEEIQQKYFRKFSKRHIINRVDYVRSVAEMKQKSQRNDENCQTKDERSTLADPHPPVVNVEGPTSPLRSDYSFFDDSFQTVIEVSSSNGTSMSNGDSQNQLMVSKDPFASYLSLHNSESQPCLGNGTSSHHVVSETEGEVNAAFSDRPNSSSCNSGSTCSLFDSYIVCNTGPKIHIIQPSIKRTMDYEIPAVTKETDKTSVLRLNVGLIQNKFKQKRQEETTNQSMKMLAVGKDSGDRYSPFPVAKKLAFKPAFKQVSSPRFSMIQTVTENVTSQLGYPPKMFLDDLNIKTPEIKVDNNSQFFDDTAFISQDVLNANTVNKNEKCINIEDFVAPLCKFLYQSVESDIQSKVGWSNLKTSHAEKNMYCNKSLPSLSDHLEEEFELHCNSNIYTRSTPCDLDTENCNFF